MKPRLTFDEKKDLVQKIDELVKVENISVKEACNRLDIPYWKYHAAVKSIKKEARKNKPEKKSISNQELTVKLFFKGESAKLVREYAETYGVGPDVICRIMLIDALKEKKKPIH